jgi:hypothetical protein
MTWTDIFNWLGKAFLKSFKLIDKMENGPNYLIIIALTVATIVWVWRMSKYNQEAEQNGTLK